MNDTTVIALLALLLFTGGKKRSFLTPVRGRISSKFGKRGDAFHNGIDIAVPRGTAVKAPADGTVLRIYTTVTGGRQMVVGHSNGYVSGYAHLSKRNFGKGAKVKRGTVIARSGDTGNVTGPHLHFSWRKNGTYKDPERFFRF